jgi:hypothetical protein
MAGKAAVNNSSAKSLETNTGKTEERRRQTNPIKRRQSFYITAY